jgi:hypothetical protein
VPVGAETRPTTGLWLFADSQVCRSGTPDFGFLLAIGEQPQPHSTSMTKTSITGPATGAHAAPQNVSGVAPEGNGRLTDWGIASVSALRQQVASIWTMTRSQRLDKYVTNQLTREQIQEWAGRAPSELPLINGEFAHIAASTPEACFRCPVCGDDEVTLATGGVLSNHRDYRHLNWGNAAAQSRGLVPVCPGSGERLHTTAGLKR